MSDPATVIAAGDHTRGPHARAGAGPYKEWHHFAVLAGPIELVLNLSVGTDTRTGATGLLGRVVALWRAGEGWGGGVQEAPVPRVPAGRVALDVGTARLSWDGAAYRLHIPDGPAELSAELTLHPETMPALSTQVPFGPRARVDWLVVPRLRTRGRVRIGGAEHVLDGALAYHDHNWGRFAWGEDFAWEWGFVLPDDPAVGHSLVFTRLLDRQRRQVRSQGLFLWEGARQTRIFVDRQLRMVPEGPPPGGPICDRPPVMGMLLPGRAAGVPGRLHIDAEDHGDRLRVELDIEAVSRLGVPDEPPRTGLTLLAETSARATVSGRIRGRPVSFAGRAVVEFVRSEDGPALPAAPPGPPPDAAELPDTRTPDLFARFLDATTTRLHHEDPSRMAALCEALGEAPVRIAVDGPAFRLAARGGRPVRLPDAPEATLDLRTDHATVLDLLDGRVDLPGAVRRGRLDLRGPPAGIAAFLDALLLYIHSGVRSAAMPSLLDRYRCATREGEP
jgi:hypothetical protein